VNYLFGLNPVLEALRAHPESIVRLYLADGALGPRVAGELLARAGELGLRVDRVHRDRLDRLAEGGVHQGVVAEAREFEYHSLEELMALAASAEAPPLLVLLDGIQDPHNLGAIVRSAHALGAQGVVLTRDRAASVTAAVIKASAGAVLHTPVARVTNLSRAIEVLKKAGYWTAALDPTGDRAPWEATLDGPLAVIVGAEGDGVRKGVLGHCDFHLKIPMLGQVDSLNASVSAGVLLYEIVRQRRATRQSP
jgi:23S rRNA (guanosine2251-2'-O)-methyltransferase